jgi:transposase
MFEGALNGAIFADYAEKFLIPSLPRESVLAMGNLPVRKAARACAAFLKAGIHILCLPPYSPDLNPTQMMWAKLKGYSMKRSQGPRKPWQARQAQRLGKSRRRILRAGFCMTDTHVSNSLRYKTYKNIKVWV